MIEYGVYGESGGQRRLLASVTTRRPRYDDVQGCSLIHCRRRVALSARDARLIRCFADGKRRVVVVLICGRPLLLPEETLGLIDSLLVAWLPGTEGGGVADVIFGRTAVSGKLSYSWPRDETQYTRKVSSPRSCGHAGRSEYGLPAPFRVSRHTWHLHSSHPHN